MKTHVIFVARFDADRIEVSAELPKARPMEGYSHWPVPVTQGYALTRLRLQAESFPIMPDGDVSHAEYGEWRSILPEPVVEEAVEQKLVGLGLGGLCVEARLAAVDAIPHGTLLEANVSNIGPYPIGKVQVVWHGEWKSSSHSREIGKGFHFTSIGDAPKELMPGVSRTFALMKPQVQKGLSYAASLSPDQYYIGVHASLPGQEAVYEIHRVPGSEMGQLIENLEHFLETEEQQ